MKKLVLLFSMFLGGQAVYSQCTTGGSLGTMPNPTGGFQTIAVTAGVSAYRTVNLTSGCTYVFSYCQGGGSYSGDPILTLANTTPTVMAWNDDFCGLGSEVTWTCTATGTYRLYFSGFPGCSNAPTATLAYRNTTSPANDVCAGAIAIANPSTTTGNTASACLTPETTTCQAYSSNGMWYSVVGDGQQYTASLCGSSYDTWVSVYSGTCGAMTCIVQNDDFCGLQSQVSWCTTVGTTYYILVNGFSTASGTWTMALSKSNVNATSSVSTICAGGSATLTGSGGTTYTWNPGALTGASVTVSPASTTTYTMSTTVGSCTITKTVTITVNPLPTVTANSSAAAVCTGSTVTLTGGGATSYAWTGGATNGVPFTPTATTTYTVTGTDGNGCTNTATTTVTVNALPTVTANSSAAAVCTGNTVTLTGGGATSYAWTGGATDGVPFTPTITDTYTVTGTDGNGCTNTATTTVTVNALPTVTGNSSAAAVCAGNTVTLTGGGATSYTWTGGATDAVPFTPTITDTYTVTGTDGNGCSNTATVTVTVNALPTVTASAAMGAICEGSSDTLMAGGASTYSWSSGGTDTTEVVMPSSTSTYTVTGTDVNGCVNTATITVNVNANPVVALGADSTQCGGSVTLDAMNAGATYMWNDSTTAQTLTASMTGTYYVTVTDSNGCWGSDTAMVTINTVPTVNLGADSTQCGGTITLDAMNAGSTYMWSDSTTAQTLVVSATGAYYVDVTDTNGCMASDSVMITINTLPTVTASAAASTVCLDDADVALTGSPAGGTWSGPGVTGSNFDPSSGTGAQTLTYSYTDSNGCSGSANTTVTVNACVGITEPAFANGVNVYPNPNSGSFTLSVANNVGDMNIEITDATGRLVYTSMESNVQAGFTKQISMEGMANGIYMMRLTTGGEQQIIKISVQN